MCRGVLILFILVVSKAAIAQVRVSKLIIKPNETFSLGESDILVADTLIMMDSSRLLLNKLKRENFIRVKVALFGNHCTIDGRGVNGKAGRKGKAGLSPAGPCTNGLPGRNGGNGLDGTTGINLFLYLEKITIKGELIIDLAGGNGGKGGEGGNGGGGGSGTKYCVGGNGANGGTAGRGGNGADGGALTVNSHKNLKIEEWVGKKIKVYNQGGVGGPTGRAGYYGSAGLGPSRKNGKDGLPGLENINGVAGIRGDIKFESN